MTFSLSMILWILFANILFWNFALISFFYKNEVGLWFSFVVPIVVGFWPPQIPDTEFGSISSCSRHRSSSQSVEVSV